ncbi:MAG: (2Fe-2S)-binding protein, partial [Bacteroidota bacterium]
ARRGPARPPRARPGPRRSAATRVPSTLVQPADRMPVRFTVNGAAVERVVEARRSLADFLREDLGLTGTHVGCEHGVCGACTVLVDGRSARSCLLLAVQLEGARVTTIEAVAKDGKLSPLQQALHEVHGLQCGFCTAGIVMTFEAYLKENPRPSEAEVREVLSGNLCRCTGYHNIVAAILRATDAEA